MISYIKGNIAYVDEDGIVIDNGGLGYSVKTTDQVVNRISIGQDIMLYTYLYIREDALCLYGFHTKEELKTFKMLIGVNGIGPRIALAVLSTLSVEDLYYAVISDDSKAIAKTPGIGIKGAAKIILELRGKLELGIGDGISSDEQITMTTDINDNSVTDTINALTALGYSNAQAYKAVSKIKDASAMSSEKLLKEALRAIMTEI